jgi:hypothetical protein
MNKNLLLSFLFCNVTFYSLFFAQDCTGNRYHQPIFGAIDSTVNIKYGANYNQDSSAMVDLFLNIYYPAGDIDDHRALVLIAHGGSFIGGTKEDLSDVCRYFASMGYVASTIDYRLLTIDAGVMSDIGGAFKKELIRAVHDMKAAIRFFRKSVADSGNPYGINPSLVLIGGYSAGAILSDHVTYMDDTSKIPSDMFAYAMAQGGLEGNSGNPGFSSVPQMVMSMCGAINDTVWIESGDQPYVGVHNLGDAVVPNMKGSPNIGITVPVTLYGDSLMYNRTLNVGVPSQYMSVPGTGHCDFPANYIDFVSNFMYNQICIQHLSIEENPNTVTFSVYPNPSDDFFYIDIPSNKWNWEIKIQNMLGQTVYNENIDKTTNRLKVQSELLTRGLYQVSITSNEGKIATQKLLIK